MYDATVGPQTKANVDKIVNEMWIAFQIDIDIDDIIKIWDIIMKANGIDLSHVEGWDKEARMPHWKNSNQCFDYENEFYYDEDSFYGVFSEELNNIDPEKDWKQKLKNFFEWNSITQK